ncbi:MAG TPA: protein kinase, partial [Streptosporangiaceae bacterium]|nr:protein kinase [Streptosporangiaceae bacterium]
MEPLSANDPRLVGEFALRARLGSGGMGRVYLGFSPGGRAVAIKVVHPELARDPEFLRRFRQEVASARLVSGMYTAPVVGSGVDDDPPWLATAYVPGPPLAEVVSLHGPLAEAAVWRLAAGLADALRAVHGCGLVHRDLKPGNVLLAADGPHVIDFGISRAFEGTQLTSAGMVVGTPGYMSPEQAEGHPAGPPSDVFSLGCVLAYAATGNAPFGGGSAASILYRVVTAEPDLSEVPANLRQVIAACLGKDAARRAGLAQLTAMISALGPPLPGTIGAFWPEPLASIIAADQAPHPATQVGGGPISPAQGGQVPGGPGLGGPGLGGPGIGGPGLGGRTWAGTPVQAGQPQGNQGVAPAGTGHAPMVADGYYAAAAGSMGAGLASPGPGPASPPYPQPAAGQSWPPAGTKQYTSDQQYGSNRQYGSGQQPAGWPQEAAWPQAGAVSPQAAMPSTGGPQAGPGSQYGTPSWPQAAGPGGAPAPSTPQASSWPPQQPSSGGSWPGGGQPSGPGGPSYPSGGTPLGQYAPGRRRPTKAEVPTPVLGAVRLMYLGAVVTALNILFGNQAKTVYTATAATDNLNAAGDRQELANLPLTRPGERATERAAANVAAAAARHANVMAGEIALVVGLGGLIGVVCWLVVAGACRRGRGWTRIAA